jgi:hypothetical protein
MAHTGTAFAFDSESIHNSAPEDQVRFLGSGTFFFTRQQSRLHHSCHTLCIPQSPRSLIYPVGRSQHYCSDILLYKLCRTNAMSGQ